MRRQPKAQTLAPLAGNRGFESTSLHRRVRNKPLWGEPPKSSELAPRRGRAWTRFPDLGARSHIRVLPPKGDRGFESTSLQRRVHCEPNFLDQGRRKFHTEQA